MVKKIFLGLVLIVASLAFISAANETLVTTDIHVITYPDKDVFVSYYEPGNTQGYYVSPKTISDQYGDAYVVYTYDVSEFNIRVKVKDGNSVVFDERFPENYFAGDEIEINAYDGNYTPEEKPWETGEFERGEWINDSEVVINDEITNEDDTQGQAATITGSAVSDVTSSPVTYAVVIALVLAGFFGMYTMRKNKRIKHEERKMQGYTNEKPKDHFIGGHKPDDSSPVNNHPNELSLAEQKLREAEREVSRLKNQGRIEELRKKIEADEAELRRLRGDN